MIKYWVIGVFLTTSLMATNKEEFNQQDVNNLLFGIPEPEKKPEVITEEKTITAIQKKKILEKKNQQEKIAVNFLINKITKWIKDKFFGFFRKNIKNILIIFSIWLITLLISIKYNEEKLNNFQQFMN